MLLSASVAQFFLHNCEAAQFPWTVVSLQCISRETVQWFGKTKFDCFFAPSYWTLPNAQYYIIAEIYIFCSHQIVAHLCAALWYATRLLSVAKQLTLRRCTAVKRCPVARAAEGWSIERCRVALGFTQSDAQGSASPPALVWRTIHTVQYTPYSA